MVEYQPFNLFNSQVTYLFIYIYICAVLFLRPVHCCIYIQVRLDGHEPNSSIPVNSDDIAVPFETPLFKGRLLVRVAGLPSRIPGQGVGARAYFDGKKRLMQCAVQVGIILAI